MKADDFIFQMLSVVRWHHEPRTMLERKVRWDSKGYLYISITDVETSNVFMRIYTLNIFFIQTNLTPKFS